MQNQRGLVFLGLAVLMGLAAVFVAQRWLAENQPTLAGETSMTQVVVARSNLPIASELAERQLTSVEWPSAHLPNGAVTSVARAKGRVLKRPLIQGEPLLESALMPEGSSAGLQVLISPNHRAVSVKVDPVIGVAGFIRPGARVDVLVTARRVDLAKQLPFSKVFLQNVKVLAVDQTLEEAGNGDPKVVNVVTLEVEPPQAERLIYASHQGKIQLALRNPKDDKQVDSYSIGVADVLGEKRKRAPARQARATTSVQVIRGKQVQVRQF